MSVHTHSPAKAAVIVTGLFLGGLLCGTAAGGAAVARAEDPYADLDLFVRVLDIIERNYVDDLTTTTLIDAAIEGMVSELDRQSRWLTADEYQDLQEDTEGQSTGIGVRVSRADGSLTVVQVLPGSPAGRDGIREGDRILELDGEPVEGLHPDDVHDRFQGPRGEPAVLTILRNGWEVPQEVRTIRDRVHEPSVEAALLEGRVVYARLVQFQEGAARDLEVAVRREAESAGGVEGLSGMVLDLRDNPGGLLDEAVAVTDLFLDEGLLVSTRRRVDAEEPGTQRYATAGGFGPDLAVIALVNGLSASASEIVASALQDTGRGRLVGERTYGKGTVQQVFRNIRPETAALKLTVGRYYTPSGKPVASGEGRAPDLEIPFPAERTAWDRLDQRLASLDLPADERDELRALLAATDPPTRGAADIPWHLPVAERVAEDPQIAHAVDLLR